MLDSVIRFSLRHRGLVVALSLVVLLSGGYLTTRLPVDVFPDLDRPRVVILTECPGLSPEEVEALVTQPIETAILGASGVQNVRSQSSPGLAVIYVEFDWRTEIRAARQVVQERLATVSGSMPEGIHPLMTPPVSIMGQFMHVGLSRRKGPQGGDLIPIGQTGLLAERTGDASLSVWRPKRRNLPEGWERVGVEDVAWSDENAGE
jgi:HME family heavy-metal exporter